ncbi:UPF0147 family protein [Candidatus Micrarchaeota archaeon]|nr:UPF0147 family protein [Candidatus Micrarchaeota archaeon]MBU1930353.1 UPF0147 family protein [Candidatus Micrarchaeota archaeon]
MNKEIKKDIEETIELMRNLAADTTVPRNIRFVVTESVEKLVKEEPDKSVGIGTVIYALEDISNDINMPAHTRTEIWTIISTLESIKEKLNQQ